MRRIKMRARRMSPRQHFALSNPIDPKDLVAVQKFAKTLTIDGRRFETILTVDRVSGQFLWHACVSVLDMALQPILREDQDEAQLKAAHAVLRTLLVGVGQPSADKLIYDEKTLQIRRPLTIPEERIAKP